MLTLDDITLRLDGFRLAVDLTLPAGGRLALMGPSGSGKSTLLSLIAGFLWPDAGRVRIAGEDMTHRAVADRPLSILFQDGNLFPHLTAEQNVALGLRPDLRLSQAERGAVADALAQVDLAGLGGRRPAALSGGQQSRVALARVLVRDRPLLLLDEPFSALDPGLRREMLTLLDGLCRDRGLTLIMASHDMRDAARLCDRLCLLEAGAVALEGPLAPLLQDPPEILQPWL
jgi:thiamine transport system ATP-binding protein